MIFLDIEVPEYESMRTQENKVPNLIKYIRGKGTVENNNEFGMEERIHLEFTVNEENFKKMLKVYARFQTLCLIPVFSSNLKHKIYDAVLEYKRSTLKAMLQSIDNDILAKDKVEEILNNTFLSNLSFKPIKSLEEYNYKNIETKANVNDCMMMFIEHFSFRTIQDSSNGFLVEMVLWTCNDLTFYNGAEEDFLNHYYKLFNTKRDLFKQVDEKIDSYFKHKDMNFELYFRNILNDRDLYNEEKDVEMEAVPTSVVIPVELIEQVEIRASNNLHRVPIVGKTKGFIQHLGKGETGITVKCILNQKNAMQNKLIKSLKALTLYEQEHIAISNSEFYLLRGMDIKEISLATVILEEPSDDVDITVVTLFFTGSSINKLELDNNYFQEMERGDSRISISLFNNFLDKVLMPEEFIYYKKHKDEVIQNNKDFNNKYKESIKEMLSMIISTHDRQNNNELDVNRKPEFTLERLLKVYRQEMFCLHFMTNKQDLGEFEYNVGRGFIRRLNQSLYTEETPKDSFFVDAVLYRFHRLAYLLIDKYQKAPESEKEQILYSISDLDNSTQEKFLTDIYSNFIAEYFTADVLSDMKKIIRNSISMVLKIEIMNSCVSIMKELINMNEFEKIKEISITENSKFNLLIRNYINKAVDKVCEVISTIVTTDLFKTKVLDFMEQNYYKGATETSSLLSSVKKAVDTEINKLVKRMSKDNFFSNKKYVYETVELLFKLRILGCRIENKLNHEKDSQLGLDLVKIINRDFNFVMNTESQVYLVVECLMSILLLDLFGERIVHGAIAIESCRNLTGPYIVTLSAIEATLNNINSISKSTFDGLSFEEYINSQDSNSREINDFNEYSNIYNVLEFLKKNILIAFGEDNLIDMLSLNKTFIKTSLLKKDFQEIHDVKIFNDFETPISFLEKISINVKSFKEIIKYYNSMLDKLDTETMNVKLENLSKTSKEDTTGLTLNVSGDKNIDDIITKTVTYIPPLEMISDLTINKFQPNAIRPYSYMQTELLGEFKTLRAMRNATRLLTYQYEKMMPDYEVFIIDEEEIRMSYQKGYNLPKDFYGINNIVSINITKDDASNLKFATIKIVNTTPHFMDINTYFETANSLSEGSTEVVYNNKFITNKLVFKAGQIVNISLDPKAQFFDFTGKIESVTVENNYITINCVNFAAELMGEVFDIKSSTASRLKGALKALNITDRYRKKIREEGFTTGNSKTNYINSHLIPENLIHGNMDTKENYDKVQGSSFCLLTKAFDKSITSLIHLDNSYNDLLMGKNLSENISATQGSFLQAAGYDNWKMDTQDITTHRILENVNAVEYDISFYGVQKVKQLNANDGKEQTVISPMAEIEGPFVLAPGHSSFVPNDFNDDFYKETYGVDAYNFDNKITRNPAVFGYSYSYNKNNIKTYDVLNDMTFRNPAAYWDVFESGNYGTLFYGRNNYMVERKNKTASLSSEDVDEISTIAVDLFDEEYQEDKKSRIDFTRMLKGLSELSTIYDQSLAKYDDMNKKIQSKVKKETLKSNKYFRQNYKANSDMYEEEQPVSNTILAISGYNLVSCSIKTNENYYNAIDIKYDPNWSDNGDRKLDVLMGKSDKVRLRTFEGLPDSRLRVNAIDPILTKDLHTEKQAFEYAQAVMFKELTNYYDGKIVILYQSDIKKNDEVLLMDSKNKITGTVVVKSFQHILDSDAGAITIITPGMKVSTSSMMTDVYLTGLVNKIQFERLKLTSGNKLDRVKFNEVNKTASAELNNLLRTISTNSIKVPIAFDNCGFKYELKKEEKATFNNVNGKQGKKFTEESYGVPLEILTPRNVSSLPFKLYPLVKNGRALIPDEDIYNSVERPFNFITRLGVSVLYAWNNFANLDEQGNNLAALYESAKDSLDLSNESIQRRIIRDLFPALLKAIENDEDQFLDRLLGDGYFDLPMFEQAIIDKSLLDKSTIVFYNCQQLSDSEEDEERLNKIAKVLSQFTIVNLVELKGYKVVEKLRKKMEYYSNSSVRKPNPDNKEWSIMKMDRLLPNGAAGDYDDVGAVLINLSKDKADKFFVDKGLIKVHGEVFDNELKSADRYVMNYGIKIHDGLYSQKVSNKFNIDIKVIHNYYGDPNHGNDASANYEIRRQMLDQLLSSDVQSQRMEMIFGDFNMFLTNKPVIENANSEAYSILDEDLLVQLSSVTSKGNKIYDNIIITKDIISNKYMGKRIVDLCNVYQFNNQWTTSDHMPVYLKFSRNIKYLY